MGSRSTIHHESFSICYCLAATYGKEQACLRTAMFFHRTPLTWLESKILRSIVGSMGAVVTPLSSRCMPNGGIQIWLEEKKAWNSVLAWAIDYTALATSASPAHIDCRLCDLHRLLTDVSSRINYVVQRCMRNNSCNSHGYRLKMEVVI